MAKIPLFTPRNAAPTASHVQPFEGTNASIPRGQAARVWRVLIVDDEEEIHTVTKLVLRNFEFESRQLVLIHASSAAEAREHLSTYKDIAVILLDVVMESDQAGLDLVREIRGPMKNADIRIVLRTGQPGQAPEENVIRTYDINDYKNKTELTSIKLKTLLYAALRSYRDICLLHAQRQGLEVTLDALSAVSHLRSLDRFTSAVLQQLVSLISYHDKALYFNVISAFAQGSGGPEYRLLASSGAEADDRNAEGGVASANYISPEADALMRQALAAKRSITDEHHFVGYFKTRAGSENLLYLSNAAELTEFDHRLLHIYCKNVAFAYENLQMQQEVEDSQRELIYMLGEAVEMRSKETGNHVKRVALVAELLAQKLGLDVAEVEIIRHASPLHDLGKMGIPDHILNKPGQHTEAERETMRTHARIGFDMLNSSDKRMLKVGAVIAHEHHEHWDGNGYPQGLQGEQINVAARITALADVCDALGSKRVYKEAWTNEAIIAFIGERSGLQFDPKLVKILLDNMDAVNDIRRRFPD
jgi:putative nucleotidyltransferase with HDIG domain